MGVFETLKQDPWPKVVDMLTLTIDRFPAYGDRLNDLVHNSEPQKLVELLTDLSRETHTKGFLRLSEEELDQIRQDLEAADDPDGLVMAAGALSGCSTGAEVMAAWDRWQRQHPREELLGVAEVAKLLGWDKRKVSLYASRGKLPQPDYRLASGPIWTRRTIERWRTSSESSEGGAKMRHIVSCDQILTISPVLVVANPPDRGPGSIYVRFPVEIAPPPAEIRTDLKQRGFRYTAGFWMLSGLDPEEAKKLARELALSLPRPVALGGAWPEDEASWEYFVDDDFNFPRLDHYMARGEAFEVE